MQLTVRSIDFRSSKYDMQAYYLCQIMFQIMKAHKKEGNSKLNTASVIYLIN